MSILGPLGLSKAEQRKAQEAFVRKPFRFRPWTLIFIFVGPMLIVAPYVLGLYAGNDYVIGVVCSSLGAYMIMDVLAHFWNVTGKLFFVVFEGIPVARDEQHDQEKMGTDADGERG